jgi:hypothetical protein
MIPPEAGQISSLCAKPQLDWCKNVAYSVGITVAEGQAKIEAARLIKGD